MGINQDLHGIISDWLERWDLSCFMVDQDEENVAVTELASIIVDKIKQGERP